MPKYTFACEKCGKSTQKFTDSTTKQIECSCGDHMDRQMPVLKGLRTNETVDKYTNKKHASNHEEMIVERRSDYYWEIEVPKLVNSGIYSLETMLEQGWVSFNEKKQMIINTKPPEKR